MFKQQHNLIHSLQRGDEGFTEEISAIETPVKSSKKKKFALKEEEILLPTNTAGAPVTGNSCFVYKLK